MFKPLKKLCVFTTKPNFDDLVCDGKRWTQRGQIL